MFSTSQADRRIQRKGLRGGAFVVGRTRTAPHRQPKLSVASLDRSSEAETFGFALYLLTNGRGRLPWRSAIQSPIHRSSHGTVPVARAAKTQIRRATYSSEPQQHLRTRSRRNSTGMVDLTSSRNLETRTSYPVRQVNLSEIHRLRAAAAVAQVCRCSWFQQKA
ncbi:uncharacterized protein LOC120424324 [Culex pipiens pallens]|uniref:uncharacterized protein LOC120424324 n=1 Tax=Culex pipiens pallens TaxID=42434 RepID=UPI0019536675|nr:uncharacterized protein LOC120424324 [Culex pipiens pallens]